MRCNGTFYISHRQYLARRANTKAAGFDAVGGFNEKLESVPNASAAAVESVAPNCRVTATKAASPTAAASGGP